MVPQPSMRTILVPTMIAMLFGHRQLLQLTHRVEPMRLGHNGLGWLL